MSSLFNDSDDFVVLSKPPRAPKRPPKQPTDFGASEHETGSSSAIVVGDCILGSAPKTTSSYWSPQKGDGDERRERRPGATDGGASCPVCNKQLEHLNESRRALHINECLDQQETVSALHSKKAEWTATLDCPLCGESLPPGPVRPLLNGRIGG